MKNKVIASIKVAIIIAISYCIAHYVNCSKNDIVSYSFALTTNIALFSLSLAITAIFFTIIDRYQQIISESNKHLNILQNMLLKEMAENTLGLLVVTFATFICSLLESFFPSRINCAIIICSMLLTFIIIFDITKSTTVLIKGMPLLKQK